MNDSIKEYFLKISKGIMHSDSTYLSHCEGIYQILKDLNQSRHVCLAGLFHSVYSTEYFEIDNPPSRQEIVNIIGEEAENLVYIFCNLRDRHSIIINNTFNFEEQTHKELAAIEYANLKEQSSRIKEEKIIELCDSLLHIITKQSTNTLFKINSRNIWLFDNFLDHSETEFLNEYCLNSRFTAGHSSSESLHVATDSRFSAGMSEQDFINTRFVPKVQKIAQVLDQDLYIGNYYLNHYGLMTGVSQHTDSAFSNHYTILVFCNKYWENTWGGEIAFYNDVSEQHCIFEFKPRRVIMFDSRIAHKVLPMTRDARKDRFTLAIKCATEPGLEDLKKQFNNIVAVRK